ncbi:MAG TPA: MATE family efflux transporter [Xanthobacteraceae bacterium]|jgi:putative MATE family efflux protein|nr:MATE family efflux transporter [Xanthobacteraceae bacterium]
MNDRSATISSPSASSTIVPAAPAPTKPGGAARTKLMLEGPILPTLLRLSAPNVLNFLAFVGMITFDGFFLGRLGTDVLAGASLAFPFVMLVLQATNSGMGNGVSSAIARALGGGKRDRADALVFHAVVLALGLGAIFACAFLFGGPLLFRGMGGQDDMLAAALAYANVALGGAVCICVLNFLGNAVRGTGNMTLPASVLVGCVVAHIALAPLLIFGAGPVPAFGPAGAAWGLVLPFAVGSIGFIWYLRSGRSPVRLNFRGVTPRWELFADILKVGVPGLVNIAVTNLSVMALTAVAARLGRDVALGYAMGARLEYVLQPIAFGVGTTIVAMVGTNWGARQYRRARAIAWTGAALVAGVCGTIGLIVSVDPGIWLGLFSNDADVFRVGGLYLHIVGPAYLFFGLGLGLFYVAQGFGRGTAAAIANATRLVVSASGGLVAIYWLNLGLAGFFAAVAIGFGLYAALLVVAVVRVKTPDSANP